MPQSDAETDELRLDAPAFHRNVGPILEVLAPRLAARSGHALEVASGTGQHAVALARRLPELVWWPSDAAPRHVQSIEAWRARADLPNLRPARLLDVCTADWPLGEGDAAPARELSALVCINMIHISPWESAQALFRLAARALAREGILYLYGPYRRGGRHTAPSNEAFDRSLRAQDPRYGVRDAEAVEALGKDAGLALETLVPMPANNCSLVFSKRLRTCATARAG
jgi:hypothetical protein